MKQGIEYPTHSEQVSADDHDAVARPDGGQKDALEASGQNGGVGQRSDDDVALDRQHGRQVADGVEDDNMLDASDEGDQTVRNIGGGNQY